MRARASLLNVEADRERELEREVEAEEQQWRSEKMAAGKEWERAARAFMTATIEAAKETRPQGTWGYYDYTRAVATRRASTAVPMSTAPQE